MVEVENDPQYWTSVRHLTLPSDEEVESLKLGFLQAWTYIYKVALIWHRAGVESAFKWLTTYPVGHYIDQMEGLEESMARWSRESAYKFKSSFEDFDYWMEFSGWPGGDQWG